MAGNKRGGHKAAATNRMRYGVNFYPTIGRLGGLKSRGGGFQDDLERAREAGRKGGQASKTPLSQLRQFVTKARRSRGLNDQEIYQKLIAKGNLDKAKLFAEIYLTPSASYDNLIEKE